MTEALLEVGEGGAGGGGEGLACVAEVVETEVVHADLGAGAGESLADGVAAHGFAGAADEDAFVAGHSPNANLLSVYGTLFLTGAMAAARNEDRGTVRTFLGEADAIADQLGGDDNRVWTSFGPTNVAIHRVATAAELGDLQVAVDLGPQVDASALPVERQVRHALEVARALSSWNRRDQALAVLLDAERLAPEQVRYHFLSRQLVLGWIRTQKGKPPLALADLARRLQVA